MPRRHYALTGLNYHEPLLSSETYMLRAQYHRQPTEATARLDIATSTLFTRRYRFRSLTAQLHRGETYSFIAEWMAATPPEMRFHVDDESRHARPLRHFGIIDIEDARQGPPHSTMPVIRLEHGPRQLALHFTSCRAVRERGNSQRPQERRHVNYFSSGRL
jgi:hypothetical protein